MYKIQQPILPIYSSTINEIGLFLWIWNPQEKSPHIGISLNGEYYSLKIDSKQVGIKTSKILSIISRKEKSVLLLDLNSSITRTNIEDAFESFKSCDADGCSCSVPLLNLFGVAKEKAILFDLLGKLNAQNMVQGYFQMNLPTDFTTIPSYSYADVQNNLQKLTV